MLPFHLLTESSKRKRLSRERKRRQKYETETFSNKSPKVATTSSAVFSDDSSQEPLKSASTLACSFQNQSTLPSTSEQNQPTLASSSQDLAVPDNYDSQDLTTCGYSAQPLHSSPVNVFSPPGSPVSPLNLRPDSPPFQSSNSDSFHRSSEDSDAESNSNQCCSEELEAEEVLFDPIDLELVPLYNTSSDEEEEENVQELQEDPTSAECISGSPVDDQLTVLKNFLQGWALESNISHKHFGALLKGLKISHPECFSNLPLDPRTILRTSVSSLPVRKVSPGTYNHIGLKKQLVLITSVLSENIKDLSLMFNVDGLPLFKNCNAALWPILFRLPCVDKVKDFVFPVGLYYGDAKPDSNEDFMQEFIEELKDLILNGLEVNEKVFRVTVLGFTCDMPAKAFILGIIGHTGYYSCTRCKIPGKTVERRRVFIGLDHPSRTDQEFRDRSDLNFRPFDRNTPLLKVPGLDLVKSFPLDYMHLVCLGVTKSLLISWSCGNIPKHKVSPLQRQLISENLIKLRLHIPVEFARKPRPLKMLPHWKATEFRLFLLYLGPVVLKNILTPEKYDHFIRLHLALTILVSPYLCTREEEEEYARELLRTFVTSTASIYGETFLTQNFHNLSHLADDISHFKNYIPNCSLNDLSAFQFENYMQEMKKYVRGRAKPLEQIGKRLSESFAGDVFSKRIHNLSQKSDVKYEGLHHNGPLLVLCKNPQYSIIVFQSFKINTSSIADNCCRLKNGVIMKVENVAFCEEIHNYAIIGRVFYNKKNLYSAVCGSSAYGIFQSEKLSSLRKFPSGDIFCKYLCLPRKNGFILLPLLHSLPKSN